MTTIELRERALFALPSSLLICLVIILLRIGPPLAIIVITLAYTFTNNTGTTVTTTNPQDTADIINEIGKVVSAFNGLAMSINSTTVAETNKVLTALSNLSSTISTSFSSLTSSITELFKTLPTTFEYNGRNYLPLAIHTNADTVAPVSGDTMLPTLAFGTPIVFKTAVLPQTLIHNSFSQYTPVLAAPLIAGNTPPTTFLSSDAPTNIDLTEDSTTIREGIQDIEAPPTSTAPVTYARKNDPGARPIQEVIGVTERSYPHPPLSWTSSSVAGTVLTIIDPLRFVLSRKPVWDKIKTYQYMRTRAKVRFQVTGNAFMGGTVRAIWVPVNRVHEVLDPHTSLTMISGCCNHVEFSASTNGTYEISLPLLFPKRFFSLGKVLTKWADVDPGIAANVTGPNDNFVSLGVIVLVVFAPLIGQASSACKIMPFSSLEDVQFADAYNGTGGFVKAPTYDVPTPVAIKNFENMSSVSTVRRYFLNKNPTVGVATPHFISRTEAMVKSFNPLIDGVKAVEGVVDSILNIASPLLGFFNLDKPRDIGTPIRTTQAWKDLAHSDGLEQATHLGLKSDCAVSGTSLEQEPCTADNSLSDMCAVEHMLGQMSLSTAVAAGKILMTWQVAPWNVPVSDTGTTPSGGVTAVTFKTYHTTASYLAQMFAYWMGAACVRIQVVGNGFSKLGLALLWVPGTAEPDYTVNYDTFNLDDLPNTHSKIFYVDGPSETEFEIPFLSDEYALLSDTTFVERSGAQPIKGVNGRFHLVLLNPLVGSSLETEVPNVTINMFVHWKDMSFYRLQSHALTNVPASLGYTFPAPPHFITRYCNTPMAAQPISSVSAAAPTTTTIINTDALFGEHITSVQDIIRRPSYLGTKVAAKKDETTVVSIFNSAPITVGSAAPDQLLGATTLYDPNVVPSTSSNFLLYLSRLYLTWRGEVCYTIVNYSEQDDPKTLSTESQAFWASTCLDRRGAQIRSIPSTGPATLSSFSRAEFLNMPGAGALYRPQNTPNNPVSVIVPYYTTHSFFYTPAYNSTTKRIVCFNEASYPAARFQTTFNGAADDKYEYHVLANAGDNFRMAYLFPPPASTSFIAPGSSPQANY